MPSLLHHSPRYNIVIHCSSQLTKQSADLSSITMGNSVIVPFTGVDIQRLKWKMGPIESNLPFQHKCSSYELLRQSKELKDYLINNLDDYMLIGLLLDKDSLEDNLMKTLRCYHQYSNEERLTIEEEFRQLESCSFAGVNVC